MFCSTLCHSSQFIPLPRFIFLLCICSFCPVILVCSHFSLPYQVTTSVFMSISMLCSPSLSSLSLVVHPPTSYSFVFSLLSYSNTNLQPIFSFYIQLPPMSLLLIFSFCSSHCIFSCSFPSCLSSFLFSFHLFPPELSIGSHLFSFCI